MRVVVCCRRGDASCGEGERGPLTGEVDGAHLRLGLDRSGGECRDQHKKEEVSDGHDALVYACSVVEEGDGGIQPSAHFILLMMAAWGANICGRCGSPAPARVRSSPVWRERRPSGMGSVWSYSISGEGKEGGVRQVPLLTDQLDGLAWKHGLVRDEVAREHGSRAAVALVAVCHHSASAVDGLLGLTHEGRDLLFGRVAVVCHDHPHMHSSSES